MVKQLARESWRSVVGLPQSNQSSPNLSRMTKPTNPLTLNVPTAFARSDGRALEDVEALAPANGFDPNVFDPAEEFDRVLLGLALACNDLRDGLWVTEQLARATAAQPEFGMYEGARMGMHLWATRNILGTVNEALESIEKNMNLLETHPDVRRCVKKLTPKGLAQWEHVTALACASKRTHGDRRFLVEMRNNLSHHYYQPRRLAEGYRHFFFEEPRSEHNALAYASVGPKFKNFRFYFVDAAAQSAGQMAGEATWGEDTSHKMKTLVEDVAIALFIFVLGFLQVRAQKSGGAKAGTK